MTTRSKPPFLVGTLSYTSASLISLFFWLLWGDFVMTTMEAVMPSLLPLLLKDEGADNGEIVLIVSTLGMGINAILNPVISYQSDRFRSRWGRRRPFIVATTPIVILFLAMIPFAPDILRFAGALGPFAKLLALGPLPPLMLVFAFLVIGFQIGNMFVGTTYYYLVPDVVPPEFVGRFYALFRMAGALSAVVFNYFIFGLAEKHMKLIFGVIAVLYGIFILLMCWMVKEGDYPPPPEEDHGHWWSGIWNYACECFGKPYFWWVFLVYGAFTWTGLSGIFSVFFFRDEMHFSLDLIGRMTAWSSVLFFLSAYPFGVLLDRWGCHKTLIVASILTALASLLMFLFSFTQNETIFWFMLRNVPAALGSIAIAKWTVEVYPRSRYGQFGSAGALVSSIGGMILGPLCGWWMDWVKDYRYFLAWSAFFPLVVALGAVVVFRYSKASGNENAAQCD